MNLRVVVLCVIVPLRALANDLFVGSIEPELIAPRVPLMLSSFEAAAPDELERIHPSVAADDRVFVGVCHGRPAALVERAKGAMEIFLDRNGDDQWTAEESATLEPSANPAQSGEAVVRFPLKSTVFPWYPVRILTSKNPSKPDARFVSESPLTYMKAAVSIGKTDTLVWIQFDPKSAAPRIGTSWLGVDANGDCAIDTDVKGSEFVLVKGPQPVFRIGDYYVSLDNVDTSARTLTFRTHPKEDYRYIEREPGTQLPDFTFRDFSGRERQLSEFSGKIVLVDFWATWCAPCVAKFPLLKTLREELAAQGFEVLGINVDQEPEKAVQMINEKGLPWVNATFDSARGLVNESFRIRMYPTYILLDGDGRIISADITGETLEQSVRQALSRSAK